MRKTNIGILLLVILLSSCGVAHTLKKAEEYLAVGEYYDAGNQYKKAFRMIPAKERSKRGEIALKQARCYAKINQSVRAAAAYANAVRYGKADKNDMLNYARQLLKQGKYKDAVDYIENRLQFRKKKFPHAPCEVSLPPPWNESFPLKAKPDKQRA